MKKVLLILDSPYRDLKGIALLVYHLIIRYGHFPIIATVHNELPALIKYKPDLILLPYVRYRVCERFLQFAKSQNTSVAILSVEGLPFYTAMSRSRIIDFGAVISRTIVGLPEFYSYIDLPS